MSFLNLTPHAVVLVWDGGKQTVPPSGTVARVSQVQKDAGTHQGFPIITSTYGAVTGLLEASAGVMVIVSTMVRLACPDRHDLASPAKLVRDAAGNIIGCEALEVNP